MNRIEKHVAVALRGLESDKITSTHVFVDGIFYFGFTSELFQRLVASLRSAATSIWFKGDSGKYPVGWSHDDIPALLKGLCYATDFLPEECSVNLQGLLPGHILSEFSAKWLRFFPFFVPLVRRFRVDPIPIWAAVVWDFPITDLTTIETHVSSVPVEEGESQSCRLTFYGVVSRREIEAAVGELLGRLKSDPDLFDLYEGWLGADLTYFQTEFDAGGGLPRLHVHFTMNFPEKALIEAISSAVESCADRLLPSPEVRDLRIYLRLSGTYTLEKELECTAREAIYEWNSMLERLECAGLSYPTVEKSGDSDQITMASEPLTNALSWNLKDAEGATVGSGETLYSRHKRIIRDKIVALDKVYSSLTPERVRWIDDVSKFDKWLAQMVKETLTDS